MTEKIKEIPSIKDIPLPERINYSDIARDSKKPEDNATRRQVFYQNATPTTDYKSQDIWVDTDDSNHTYRADGNLVWVSIRDGSIATSQAAADAAQAAADAAQSDATANDALLDDIADDAKITPVEKLTIKPLWDAIVAEKVEIDSEADTFGVSKTNFTTAYDALNLYLNTTVTVFGNMTTTTTIVRATWDGVWEDYFDEKIKILNAISSAAKALADAADGATAGDNLKDSGASVLEDEDVVKVAQTVFGDGSDGTVDINSGTFSSGPITSNALTRDAYFDNLTLSGGDLDCAGYRLFVKGTLTTNNSYTVHRNGSVGTSPSGATGGAGGTTPNGSIGGGGAGGEGADNGSGGLTAGGDANPGMGGAGGAGGLGTDGGAGAAAGTVTAPATGLRASPFCTALVDFKGTSSSLILGGAGGGGGGFGGTGIGGAGGGSGAGVLLIAARVLVNNGTISAVGGNGGNGTGGQKSGGGGGGGGGLIVLIYALKSGSGTTVVTAGTGGTGDEAGSNGSVGTIIELIF